MAEVTKSCTNCAHRSVCSLRENRSKLDGALKNLEKMSEYREFSMHVSCRYYMEQEPKPTGGNVV